MTGDTDPLEGARLSDYTRVLWRRKWVVIAAAILGLMLALGRAYITTPLYRAETTLIYERPLDVSNPFSGSYSSAQDRETELSSVPSIITSPDVTAGAREQLKASDITTGYSVTAGPPENVTAGTPGTGTTVVVTATSPSAPVAKRVADAYATAFTEYRKEQEKERVRQAIRVIQNQVDAFATPESRRSAEYYTLLQRLQDLQILEATATGNFRILVPATAPSRPFSPMPIRDGIIGLAAGLVIGIGLALLSEQFDTRVRTQEEAAAIVGMPVVGIVPRLPAKMLDVRPLAVLADPRGAMAEAIRKVRGNLEFANVDGDLKSLIVTSSLQHEGKSLMVCNLALSMAATGKRVLLVDGDLRRPRIHVYLDLPNTEGVATVLTGKGDLREALLSVPVEPRFANPATQVRTREVAASEHLHVLTSGPVPPNPAELVASRSFATMIAEAQQDHDLVIIDSPSVLAVGDTAAMARSVNGLVFVVDLMRAKRPFLREAARQIGQMPCRKVGLVVTTDTSSHRYRHHYEYEVEGGPLVAAPAGGSGERIPQVRTRR